MMCEHGAKFHGSAIKTFISASKSVMLLDGIVCPISINYLHKLHCCCLYVCYYGLYILI